MGGDPPGRTARCPAPATIQEGPEQIVAAIREWTAERPGLTRRLPGPQAHGGDVTPSTGPAWRRRPSPRVRPRRARAGRSPRAPLRPREQGEGQRDLHRRAREQAPSRLHHGGDGVDAGDRVHPAGQQRERHIDGGEEQATKTGIWITAPACSVRRNIARPHAQSAATRFIADAKAEQPEQLDPAAVDLHPGDQAGDRHDRRR